MTVKTSSIRKALLFFGSMVVVLFLSSSSFLDHRLSGISLNSQLRATLLSDSGIVFPFINGFTGSQSLNETASPDSSTDPYLWLDSGGVFYFDSARRVGRTISGDLPAYSPWRIIYQNSNPLDTDDGLHPQNIFRLVTRQKFINFGQEAYFRILKDNLSQSPNRNESNGLLFFLRYQDQDNLYYAGIRVDGSVVVKKKYHGDYTLLTLKNYFPGGIYDRNTNPNLVPKDTWIGLRAEIANAERGSVKIDVYVDNGRTGKWQHVVSAIDSRANSGSPIIDGPGGGGIRTDFMDVEISDYMINKI